MNILESITVQSDMWRGVARLSMAGQSKAKRKGGAILPFIL